MSAPHPTGRDQRVAVRQQRNPLGWTMQPVAPRTAAPEAVTLAWASSISYTGQKSVLWNNARSLGLIDRGANLVVSGAWGLNTVVGVRTAFFLEFWCKGSEIAVAMSPNNPSGIMDYKIWVDGWEVQDWETRSYTGGIAIYRTLEWSTSKVRLVRVAIGGTAQYNGLYMPSATYVSASRDSQFRCAVIGDSWTQGGQAGGPSDGLVGASAFAGQLAIKTGWDVYAAGIGGSGYCNPAAGGNEFGGSTRLTQLAALPELDLILVVGSVNDPSGGFTTSQLSAAASTFYSALQAARPTTPIVVAGIQSQPFYTGYASWNTALLAAAAAHPQVRATIDMMSTPWSTGTGKITAKNGTGNADLFIDDSGYHLTRDGHVNFADRLTGALRSIRV